ncbi:MAG: hypothetical protein M1820_003113 [Bogoriella megaspora]|nr:MAG: hypothetical protein M1820_003113 [Bogoriella megaspora]
MASQTFHPFPRLPKELRDIIWALSIRPERPGAHFFTLFNCDNIDEWITMGKYAMRPRMRHKCSLAAPKRNVVDSQKLSWTDGNRSAYLIDAGLSTACQESREAAERHFQISQWNAKMDGLIFLPDDERQNLNVPALGSFVFNGEWWRCTTYPRRDLFCLQPSNASTVDWGDLPYSVPIFNSFNGYYTEHIALNYDPEWSHEIMDCDTHWANEGTLACAIRAATDQTDWAENLWFIDYRIRRRPNRCTAVWRTTEFRHQFHGNGCRFTEVQSGDPEWKIDRECDIFHFLDNLDELVSEYMRRCVYVDGSDDGRPVSHDGAPSVGVLAYEVDTS